MKITITDIIAIIGICIAALLLFGLSFSFIVDWLPFDIVIVGISICPLFSLLWCSCTYIFLKNKICGACAEKEN